MVFVLGLIFFAIAAGALAFVCWPLWRGGGEGRGLLAGALAALMLAITGGAYIFVGHPELAMRALAPPKNTDFRALVSMLAWRMRQSPDDPRGWAILGRSYMALGDAGDAALAYKRAIALSPPAARSLFLPAYGMALTAETGSVTPDAEAAFRAALAHDPGNPIARFYLGQAFAERRDRVHALAIWQSLLADTPPNAPWRGALVDRIALLSGTAPQAPPNIAAMVQSLADRLKRQPNDPEGWQRLVKAYVVLGDTKKAEDALGAARKALAGDRTNIALLDQEARALKLEK